MHGKTAKGHICALVTILVWGITFINTKYLIDFIGLSPMFIMFVRYLVAYVSLWLIKPKPLKFQGIKKEAVFLICALSGAAVYQFLENLSVAYTNPASVSFITALAPVFTAILAHFTLKETVDLKTVFGMTISLIGVFFVSFGDSSVSDTGLWGDLIILCGVWLWAVYSIEIKKTESYGIDEFLITRRVFLYSLIFIIPYTVIEAKPVNPELFFGLKSILNLLFLGVLASAICFYTWNHAVYSIGATETGKYLFVMPVITLFAQMVYDKFTVGKTGITFIAVVGMVLILIGLFVSEMRRKKR